jgi:hypothetical protein
VISPAVPEEASQERAALRRRIRTLLGLFVIGLILSGLTAFPLVTESRLLDRWIGERTPMAHAWPAMALWITRLHRGLEETASRYPFVLYGTDWLGFAHLMIAVAFIGPLKDPVRNLWVVEFGMIACVLVIPLALIMGPIRGIPVFWRMIDCSFGVVGILPLWLARRDIVRLVQPDPIR